MRGLDEILVNAIMQTVKKEISSKDFEGIVQQLQNQGMQMTDILYRFPELKKYIIQFHK